MLAERPAIYNGRRGKELLDVALGALRERAERALAEGGMVTIICEDIGEREFPPTESYAFTIEVSGRPRR